MLMIFKVVQHGRKVEVNIQKTEKKGWGKIKLYSFESKLNIFAAGVFAGSKRILANSFVGIYAGELLTDAEGDERTL